jgi:uncharacterized oligopeptide transporter (OPT) family protein
MAKRIKQFVIYARVTAVIVLLTVVAVVIAKNWSFKTKFWPWADDRDVPTLWLMLLAGVFSIIAYWVLSKTRRVLADLAELSTEKARLRQHTEQEQRRQELDDQERRIDKKIKDALDDPDPGP